MELFKFAEKFIIRLAEAKTTDEKLLDVAEDMNSNVWTQLQNVGQWIKYSCTYGWEQMDPSRTPTPYVQFKFAVMEPDKSDYSEEQKQYNMIVLQLKKMRETYAIDDLKNLLVVVKNIDIPGVESININ
jgi:hypothetical protein